MVVKIFLNIIGICITPSQHHSYLQVGVQHFLSEQISIPAMGKTTQQSILTK